ncbi:MAG: hypothetical protein DBX04_04515 [Candidatus Poseidoniales archaeon]|nr:MAG: hypothetical protein DBX04_04515 [Candidatus Poseidoniales archaeon]
MDKMDFMEILFLALGAFLLFGGDLIVGIMSLKSLGDRKAKTGRYTTSWSSMGVVRKGMFVGLLIILTAFGLWWAMPR